MKRCIHRRLRRALGTLLLLGAGLWAAAPAKAADKAPTKQYDVEIVVFAYANPDTEGELWPADPGRPDLSEAATPGTDGVTLLGSSDYRLSNDERRLRRSSRYRPVLHMAWRQSAGSLKEGRAVHIHGSDDAGTVDGSVKLSLGRFLHLGLDLLYRPGGSSASPPPGSGDTAGGLAPAATDSAPPSVSSSVETPTPGVYRMRQHRRMRSGEVHYFDNPVFGVLAVITPYEPPAPKPAPASADDGAGAGSGSP